MESNLLKQGERLDDLQLGGLGLIQDPDKFCFGVDAVLLSDFAKVRSVARPSGREERPGNKEHHTS